eukprot:Gregarina_sp_Pseudo_9__1007@NODE_164_length_3890_cov_24_320956_g151_i0_p1_GENE_NODE_164_length_3890_cov_24_320956_g151_i0NODE_164_length_3890_cov_24_320956_g151_i0_p1_ORF_typecomplete_len1170_score213_37Flu_NS2/PF00601_19/0_37_NODE_164_length_3890_cov_24_320956_g151_i03103819
MSNIPSAEPRSCDQPSQDQHVDVIVENNPAELQGASKEVLQALTLRAALVSSVDANQCVEAHQSYSLLSAAPYAFSFRTGNNYLLDSCRIWVFKSMMGQTDADTGDIDIKDLLLYPRQERKTCVLSTGATCVVTVSVSGPTRGAASMTRVPPHVETAVPWGLRTAADSLDNLVHEGSEPFPVALEGKPLAAHHASGLGLYFQTSNRGHTRSLSPVPRTVWASSRLVAPPVTSLPTPMAATRSSTLTYQASPISRRSPLAPEHPRLATYSTSGLAYSAMEPAPAIKVTSIHPSADLMQPVVTIATPTLNMAPNVSARHMVKLNSGGDSAIPAEATQAEAHAGMSPPKPVASSGETSSPGESSENRLSDVIDLEQGSAGRRDKQQKKAETPASPAVAATEKVDVAPAPAVEAITTSTGTTVVSRVESTTEEEEEETTDKAQAGFTPAEKELRDQLSHSIMQPAEHNSEPPAPTAEVLKVTTTEPSSKTEDLGVSEVVETDGADNATASDDGAAHTADREQQSVDDSDSDASKVYELAEFVCCEPTSALPQIYSSALASHPDVAIVGPHTKVYKCPYRAVRLAVNQVHVSDRLEAFVWKVSHKDAYARVLGMINAPWDVSFRLVPSSAIKVSVELGEEGTYAYACIDVPRMTMEGGCNFSGDLQLWHAKDGSPCTDFGMAVHLTLIQKEIDTSPIVNIGKTRTEPKYNTCVLTCCGVEDSSAPNLLNSYKIGVGMNSQINTYVLVDNSNAGKTAGGICLNLENLEQKVVTLDVYKIISSKGKDKLFLGSAKFDLNELTRQHRRKFNGILEIYEASSKLSGVALRVEIALEDEVEEEDLETLTDFYVKSTIMRSMTMNNQKTSPQLDQTFNKLRSVIEEIPAAKAKRKMIGVLREVPVARHKKLMTKVVKEVPVAQTKKKMVPVLEDIAKRPYRKCMSNVVEEFHQNNLKKAMKPVIEEVPLQPMKKTLRKLCTEIPSAVERRSLYKKSLSLEGHVPTASESKDLHHKTLQESVVETTEEPCVFKVVSSASPPSMTTLSHRTTDSEGTTSEVRGSARETTTKVKSSSRKTRSSMATSTSASSKSVNTAAANDIAVRITKAITEDPACASLDPSVVIKMLDIFRKNLSNTQNATTAVPPPAKDVHKEYAVSNTTSSRSSVAKTSGSKVKGSLSK